jgi:hypothetical protein
MLYFIYNRHVDDNKDKYIQRLKELVEIPSVSAWPEKRPEIVKVCKIVANVSNKYLFV